ncbi:hypothetical protein KPH14_010856 [Odynerus spinipes]|uniref:Endonuclease III homolog n=1 Tax=Odynerus spinipes TaxID=1348599 RepID=A0AAD9VMV5_9HYME|nr:hypothetical protein KPH14_010856 [Odynerus spinipes]
MSKKLKLAIISTPRRLRSNQQQIDNVIPSERSPYFGQKSDHSSAAYSVEDGSSTEVQNKINEEIASETRLPKTSNESEKSQRKRKNKKGNAPLKIKYDKSENIESKNKSDEKDLTSKKDEKVEDDLGNASNWMPSNWNSILKNIKEMRKYKTAPVDEMGCHKCADPNASDPIFRYQCLLALMLSSQTKDQVTHAAMKKLITYGCTPSTIIATPNDVLVKLIHPVGFANKKAEYIKKTSVILLDKYNGDIPKTINELCNLPGVGPKMAHICMQIAWGEISGIGVDTHVHRICNRLNWVKKPTKTPEETRKELEGWLPKDLWNDINYLLVGFGQEICLPRFPKCTECLNKDICPFVRKK